MLENVRRLSEMVVGQVCFHGDARGGGIEAHVETLNGCMI